MGAVVLALALVAGCGGPDPAATVPDASVAETAALEPMEPVALLFRASMDLRGHRPTLSEIERVEGDPASIDALIDGFLYDDAFGERVVDLYSNAYLTRQDSWNADAEDYGLDPSLQPAFAAAVGEEPLRMLARIATEDLPFTEIVTGDWTMADDVLAQTWPVTYPDGATGWQTSAYTDGRPAAGVLSTNGFWWRYMSNASNANRGRANAISKVFLCTDYLNKEIAFSRDVDLLDADAINDALQNNPGCVACHHSLDPLASYLWGFYYVNYTSWQDITYYHPEREQMWVSETGVAPGFYGEPGYGLEELGSQLAADPRLPNCFVQQSWEILLQRDESLEDTETLSGLRETFLANDLTVRPLLRAILSSEQYRAGPTDDPQAAPLKLVSTDQLASQVEHLTGFRFTYDDWDMLQTDTYGLRTLAGGVDGSFVTQPATEPITTLVLVQERLAQAAASHVVAHDRATDSPRLFTQISFGETPSSDADAMVAQIQQLHLLLFGERVQADSEQVDANLALWEDLFALSGDAGDAWAGVLTVLMRDPAFLVY